MLEEISLHFDEIIQKFERYYGGYFYFPLLLFAIIIVFSISKKKNYTIKTICFWLPIIAMLVVFNPIAYKILNPFVKEGDDYWRFFWIIPMVSVIAFVFTKLVVQKKKFVEKIFIILFVIILLFFGGKLVYSEENFQKVNNYYKMPDDILEAIRIVQNEDIEEKKVMVPISVVPWVRQYDGTIKVNYCRSSRGKYSQFVNDFDKGIIDKYMKKIINDKCNFIIINNKDCDCKFESYGYKLCGENASYKVYVNEKI